MSGRRIGSTKLDEAKSVRHVQLGKEVGYETQQVQQKDGSVVLTNFVGLMANKKSAIASVYDVSEEALCVAILKIKG